MFGESERVDGSGRVAVRQRRIRVVSRFVVVVLDVQTGQLGKLDAQRTARIVYILAVQRLRTKSVGTRISAFDYRISTANSSYSYHPPPHPTPTTTAAAKPKHSGRESGFTKFFFTIR